MMRYFIKMKPTGEERECPADKTAEFFRLIESLTGLDRAMASMILRSGQTVEHPSYSFRSSMNGQTTRGTR